MHEDGIDAGNLEKDDVPHEGGDEFLVVHGGPAYLDEKGFSPEPLQVGQGLNEGGGFVFAGQWAVSLATEAWMSKV